MFDQSGEFWPRQVVRSYFALDPSSAGWGAIAKPSLAAIFMVLEKGEGFGNLFRVLSGASAIGEDEEPLVAFDEGFFEFDEGGVVFLFPKLVEFVLEGDKVFGAEVKACWFLLVVEHWLRGLVERAQTKV